jgi:von Willebrand factor A domain-containing protein 7
VPLCFLVAASSAFAQQPTTPNRSRRFGPDACGPADPNYIRVANESGGLPMFLQPSEAAKAFHLIRQSTQNNVVTLFWTWGTLEGGAREFTVPVDSTIENVTFSLSVDNKGTSMTVDRPSGAEAAAGDAGLKLTELNCGRILTVNAPETGAWRVRVSGSGRFWLEAQAKSEIFLVRVEFVKRGGRPGHEGLFKISGQPLAGVPATLESSLSGSFAKADFKLVSEAGEVIKPIEMRLESSSSNDREYVGRFELPSQPFRVAAAGQDEKGVPYQRFFHTLFHAETVEVEPAVHVDDLPPGKTTSLSFKVRNVGPPATFRILVADSRRFVSRIEPKELALDTGASGTVTVDLAVPADTKPGTGVDVTITATSAGPPATSNGTAQHLSVFGNPQPQ